MGLARKGLLRYGIGMRFSRPANLWISVGWVFAGLGLLRDGPKRVMQDYMDPYFSFISNFT